MVTINEKAEISRHPICEYFENKIKARLQEQIKTTSVSLMFTEYGIKVIASCRSKKHDKPAVISVTLNKRAEDKIKTLDYISVKTKEMQQAADTLLDEVVANLRYLKDVTDLYVYSSLLGVEYYKNYTMPDARNKRKITVSKEPKLAEVKAREDEIKAKHNELMKVSLEESLERCKVPSEQYARFYMYGRVKSLLEYLKGLDIVGGYRKFSGEYIVSFSQQYQCNSFYLHEQWAEYFKNIGYRVIAGTQSYWD